VGVHARQEFEAIGLRVKVLVGPLQVRPPLLLWPATCANSLQKGGGVTSPANILLPPCPSGSNQARVTPK
jgi:hypothetical protein